MSKITTSKSNASSKMNLEDKIARHRKMAEGYYNAYLHKGVQTGEKYESWKFADDATGWWPYFMGDEIINLAAVGMDPFQSANMEAASYSAKFPDWGPKEFTCWPSDNGFAMRTKWEGTNKATGKKMAFWSVGLVLVNDKGEVTHWETLVDDSEFGAFLEVALGVRGPFKGETAEYMNAVSRALEAAGIKI